ncbi:bacillithiol biosynthesis deacetylase BshB1 [Sesbania bispinosa]|nr:bacillithiol biosynthesis deacetylase BshB1 [Sesbania bispinosa]
MKLRKDLLLLPSSPTTQLVTCHNNHVATGGGGGIVEEEQGRQRGVRTDPTRKRAANVSSQLSGNPG